MTQSISDIDNKKTYYVPHIGPYKNKKGLLIGDINYIGCYSGWHTLKFEDGFIGYYSGDEIHKLMRVNI
jgi:hypothetical protein